MAKEKILKNSARQFELNELFFSTTDENGKITGCNDVFLRVADYKPHEILNKPHNIVRHPEMPRCVFKLLWDYLLAGKTIGAYVKNLAATGEYYWVYALACPIENGFLSIRFKPTSPIFSIVQSLYGELLAIEQRSAQGDRRQGMEQSTNELSKRLKVLGFQNYDAFLNESLRLEIESVAAALIMGRQGKNTGPSTDLITTQLRQLKALQLNLSEKSAYLNGFIKTLHNLSANASVRARHVGNQGRALGVIGEELSRSTNNLKSEIKGFEALVEELSAALQNAAFKLSMAFLQGEMAERFKMEAKERQLSEEAQISLYGQTFSKLTDILETCRAESSASVATTFLNLGQTINSFNNFIDFLDKLIQTLQFGYVTGQAEVAGISDDKGFSLLLNDLNTSSDKARNQLYELRSSVQAVSDARSAI